MRRPPLALVVLALAGTLAGCGARTGLSDRLDASADGFDAGLDAGLDAGPPDGGPIDAGLDARACGIDADCDDGLDCTLERCDRGACVLEPRDERCDDGLFCTGEERCELGRGCVATPPSCGDPVACTIDRCDEAIDGCVNDPEADLCPISHRCDPVRGCVARALAHDPTLLYEVDLPGGDLSVIGPTGRTLTDLALHPDGTLYGAVSGALVTVDLDLMRVEEIAPIPGAFNALDVGPDGLLYGAADERVVRFDPATGAVTTIATLPTGLRSSGDLAFVSGRLYLTAVGRAFDDVLMEIDVGAGTTRFVGRIGHGCVWGLAPFGDVLYGLTCEGKLLEIDETSGAARVLSRGTREFYGAGAR